ncbi:MAG: hypothetical protein ACO4CG_03990 [Prochlorothrix sp.]|nr:hypothetical protein [Prochlorothrix sp.]
MLNRLLNRLSNRLLAPPLTCLLICPVSRLVPRTLAALTGAATLATTPLLTPLQILAPSSPAEAGTCASHCGEPPLRFEPGGYVAVQIVNLTTGVIEVQESQGSDPFPVAPGRITQLERRGTTAANASILFWDTLGLALKAQLIKVDDHTLRVELHPNYHDPTDRSLYLRDDGRIDIF